MSYSSLVSYYNKSPYCESRNGNKIQGFAIHCYVGQVAVKRGVDGFKSRPEGREASANYVVAYDGEIGCAVDDELRSWCTSDRVDEKVITIECASDNTNPYRITDKCYESLIALLADRCKVYGIKRLSFANDADYGRARKLSENYQNIVCHRWYDTKACPGQYIMDLLISGKICTDVNEILSGDKPAPEPPVPPAPEPPEYDYCSPESIILGIGDEGHAVVTLQGALMAHGYDLEDCGGADGIFGEGTEKRVKEYQRDHKLEADGVVGEKTWGLLTGTM